MLAAILALAFLPTVSAHAALSSAAPAPNGHEAVGRVFVELRFSENVERQYTSAIVTSLSGETLNNGATQFDDDEPNVLRVPVQAMGDGIYGVAWKTLSVDAHVASGQYVFSVGNSTIRFPEPVFAQDASTTPPSAVLRDGFAKSSFYLGLFVALGAPLFALVVDRPRSANRSFLLPVATFGLLGALGAALSLVFLRDLTLLSWSTLFQTTSAQMLAGRGILLAIAALFVLVAAYAPERAGRNLLTLGLVVAAGALIVTSLSSPAAAARNARLLAVLADATHLVTGAVWVGGAFGFVLVFRHRSGEELRERVSRFAPWAVASIALLLVTGTFAALRTLPEASDLLSNRFGQLVTLKIGLVAALALILGRYRAKPVTRRAITLQALGLVLVVAAAGVLSASTPPDAPVVEGSQGTPSVLELTATTKTTHVVLVIRPNPVMVENHTILVQLHSLTAQTIPNGTSVSLGFVPPGESEPQTLITLERKSPNDWSAPDGSYLTREGNWTVQVVLERPDESHTSLFQVPVTQENVQTAG